MKSSLSEIAGDFTAPKKNIAIVASRFNEFVVERLISGAQDILIRHGVNPENIHLFRVPGAFELPLVCQQVATREVYAGIIALGVVVRGATAHFEYVSNASAMGILQVQLKTNIPITFGVLTTENLDQAIQRAGSTVGNKGTEAALSLLEVISLLGKIND